MKPFIMKKILFLTAICLVLIGAAIACQGLAGFREGPCDIYKKSGTPCVTAHSTTRLLYSKYRGPLYQVVRESDGAMMDIYARKNGIADAAAQDDFCKGTMCYISVIYDQSGMGNDLLPAPPGTFQGPDKGGFNTRSIADMAPALVGGQKVYGAYVMPGMGYRCNDARGLAVDDEPEGMYYVIDGNHYDSGCCFDYGNSSTNGRAVGTGTMETTYYGSSTAWGRGNGDGPWIMSDMEAGLFSGYDPKQNDVPSITDWRFVSVFVNGGGGNRWDLRGAEASCDTLTVFYSGPRPHSKEGTDTYYPMHKKGGMLMGNGGDNGNGSAGTFFEGVMTVGYPTEEAIAAVQKNIARAGYRAYPLSLSRITTFTPGGNAQVGVFFETRWTSPSRACQSKLRSRRDGPFPKEKAFPRRSLQANALRRCLHSARRKAVPPDGPISPWPGKAVNSPSAAVSAAPRPSRSMNSPCPATASTRSSNCTTQAPQRPIFPAWNSSYAAAARLPSAR